MLLETTPNWIDSAIGRHLLDNDQSALNYNKQPLYQDPAPGVMQTESLFTLSNSFDNCGVLMWPLAALSLVFRCCEIFLWRALQY